MWIQMLSQWLKRHSLNMLGSKGFTLTMTPVGFVMVDANKNDNKYYFWRFMIDAKHQGLGLGKQAIELLLVELKL